jgi:hypothetical protein
MELHAIVSEDVILHKIYIFRGEKVMLDSDLADLYGVQTKVLKQAVRRNLMRFPEDFMFNLNPQEFQHLRSQTVTSSWGGSRYLPMAFTEQGVAMLSSILNTARAIQVNIQIIRIFVKIRKYFRTSEEIMEKLSNFDRKILEHDKAIADVFEYLNELDYLKQQEELFKNRKRIGFKP